MNFKRMKWFLLVVSLLAMSSAMAGNEPNAPCCTLIINQEVYAPMSDSKGGG
jgi:hypothetical protein